MPGFQVIIEILKNHHLPLDVKILPLLYVIH